MKILLLNDEFYTTGASIAMLRLPSAWCRTTKYP